MRTRTLPTHTHTLTASHRSDNVVRAGLTPKWKDVATLVAMLTYASGHPHVQKGDALDAFSRLYRTPVPEFNLLRTELPPRTGADAAPAYTLPAPASAAIIVVTSGTALVTAAFVGSGAPAGSAVRDAGSGSTQLRHWLGTS